MEEIIPYYWMVLLEKNVEIVSIGDTADYIRKQWSTVVKVFGIPDFPEILGGKVLTLPPFVFGCDLGQIKW